MNQQSSQDEKVDPSMAPTHQNWHETFYRIVIAQRLDVENEDEDDNLEILALDFLEAVAKQGRTIVSEFFLPPEERTIKHIEGHKDKFLVDELYFKVIPGAAITTAYQEGQTYSPQFIKVVSTGIRFLMPHYSRQALQTHTPLTCTIEYGGAPQLLCTAVLPKVPLAGRKIEQMQLERMPQMQPASVWSWVPSIFNLLSTCQPEKVVQEHMNRQQVTISQLAQKDKKDTTPPALTQGTSTDTPTLSTTTPGGTGSTVPKCLQFKHKGKIGYFFLHPPKHFIPLPVLHQKLSQDFSLSPGDQITGVRIDSYSPQCPLFYAHKLKEDTQYEIVTTTPEELEKPQLPSFINLQRITVEPKVFLLRNLVGLKIEENVEEASAMGKEMIAALKDVGFFRVRVPKAQAHIAEEAMKAAAQFFDHPSEEKAKTTIHAKIDPFRMVGYDKQVSREFFQVRRGQAMTEAFGVATTMSPDIEKATKAAFDLQDQIARLCLRLLLTGLGVSEEVQHRFFELFDSPGFEDSTGELPEGAVGAAVLKLYKYNRECTCNKPEGNCKCPFPGLRNAATTLHADMGVITVSPVAKEPGLVLLQPDCTHWIDGEADAPTRCYTVFLGELFSRALLKEGVGIPATLHYVFEKPGKPRYAMPYFMRGKPSAILEAEEAQDGRKQEQKQEEEKERKGEEDDGNEKEKTEEEEKEVEGGATTANGETIAHFTETALFLERPWAVAPKMNAAKAGQGADY